MFSDAIHQIMPSVAEDVALALRARELSRLEKADIVSEVLAPEMKTLDGHTLQAGARSLTTSGSYPDLTSQHRVCVGDCNLNLVTTRHRILAAPPPVLGEPGRKVALLVAGG
jgi:hypothetical protein